MADPPYPQALFLLLLSLFLVTPRFSQAGRSDIVFFKRFSLDRLMGRMTNIFDAANDGGLRGEAGHYEDDQDSMVGEEAGFLPVDALDELRGDEFSTSYGGAWELVSNNSGVSAMHMQLLPNNKVVIFDSTVFGPSQVMLRRGDTCPIRGTTRDCTAHAVVYDIETAALRPLHIDTNPWCSSGGLTVDGSLLSTGGFHDGAKSTRKVAPCDTCDWQDTPNVLGDPRWYATQTELEDGSFFVIGGRKVYSYEFIPVNGKPSGVPTYLPFMDETTDLDENNLYPFVHLLPDGNLFIFANSRSILFDPKGKRVIKEFPRLLGGSRNYPASGMSVLLPLQLTAKIISPEIKAQVLVCGGAKPGAFRAAEKNKTYLPALQDCGRLVVTDQYPQWIREKMPSRRVMGDMLILPTGDILMLNGAQKGSAAWFSGKQPNFKPVLFKPNEVGKDRFRELQPTTIPRMYHSTSMLLPDARILVGGSNTNPRYKFTGVEFPTEMRMEKFSPPYLDPVLQKFRPRILLNISDKQMTYGNKFHIGFQISHVPKKAVKRREIKITMYAPPFTTHGFSMNQRLVQLGISRWFKIGGINRIVARAPPSGTIAPPGFYLVFVVYRGVPSVGVWVQIQG
ncbi:hypothetical protein SAY86_020541 [Trapa natans]|uniref:Galactose oxidase n=1 Tax=Trapa natans TaxID=22666 RepID=A0AAN7LNE5_TRANT|nr:hypothetical protein SAY86_020541 [Trapa natans]